MKLIIISPDEHKRVAASLLEYGDFEPEDRSVGIFGSWLGVNLEGLGWCCLYNDGELRNNEDKTVGYVEDMTEESFEEMVIEAAEIAKEFEQHEKDDLTPHV